jgi:hypothetical protein
VSNILDRKEEERAMISLLWAWWNARSKANAGEQMPTPEFVASHVQEMTSSFLFSIK